MREGVREAEGVEETSLIPLLMPSPLCVLLNIYGIHQDSAPSSAYTSTNPGFFALWISVLQTPIVCLLVLDSQSTVLCPPPQPPKREIQLLI